MVSIQSFEREMNTNANDHLIINGVITPVEENNVVIPLENVLNASTTTGDNNVVEFSFNRIRFSPSYHYTIVSSMVTLFIFLLYLLKKRMMKENQIKNIRKAVLQKDYATLLKMNDALDNKTNDETTAFVKLIKDKYLSQLDNVYKQVDSLLLKSDDNKCESILKLFPMLKNELVSLKNEFDTDRFAFYYLRLLFSL